jgi:hypothetical protein
MSIPLSTSKTSFQGAACCALTIFFDVLCKNLNVETVGAQHAAPSYATSFSPVVSS